MAKKCFVLILKFGGGRMGLSQHIIRILIVMVVPIAFPEQSHIHRKKRRLKRPPFPSILTQSSYKVLKRMCILRYKERIQNQWNVTPSISSRHTETDLQHKNNRLRIFFYRNRSSAMSTQDAFLHCTQLEARRNRGYKRFLAEVMSATLSCPPHSWRNVANSESMSWSMCVLM
jgi:hypothetical protein